jgi:hypothetical protein
MKFTFEAWIAMLIAVLGFFMVFFGIIDILKG